MILYIDNYDTNMSAMYKLLSDEYTDICVVRSDEQTAEELVRMAPDAVIIGSGAGSIPDAGCCTEAAGLFAGRVPVLGTGLGAHILCAALGGSAVETKIPANKPYNTGFDTSSAVFEGMEQIICCSENITSTVAPDTLPQCLTITARDEYGRGLSFEHNEYPVFGLCLSPLSLGEENCRALLRNFISLADK